jgi:hypothetical protein
VLLLHAIYINCIRIQSLTDSTNDNVRIDFTTTNNDGEYNTTLMSSSTSFDHRGTYRPLAQNVDDDDDDVIERRRVHDRQRLLNTRDGGDSSNAPPPVNLFDDL